MTETLNFDYTLSAHNVVESLHFRLKIKTGFAGTLKINKAVEQWGIYTIASYKRKPMTEIKKGDFVKVTGEGTEAFQVEWTNKGSVGLHNGSIEPLNKIDKLDPDKFEITPYTIYYWREKD